MADVSFLSPSQLKRALIILWQARVPAAVFGGPGCGKTTAVYDLISELNEQQRNSPTYYNYKLWPMILSYKGPEDIGGIPYPNKEHTRVGYLLPEDLPFNTEEHGIIFGDEFDRATPDTQNAFLQILLGGCIHGAKLSPNAYVVLAMNGVSDIYTTQLSAATITRVCSLFVSSNKPGFEDSYDMWAAQNKISPLMRAFAKFTPDLLTDYNDFEALAQTTPRTRDMADRILTIIDHVNFSTVDIIGPLLEGVIGRAATVKLLSFRDLYGSLPTIDDIMANPDTVKVPEQPSLVYALICGLIARVKRDGADETRDLVLRRLSTKICTFAVRLPDELTACLFRQVLPFLPIVVTDAIYTKWAKEHKFILSLD